MATRSGYVDDYEYAELYRANVRRAIRSKRGQRFLRELADVMDAMPEKVLIADTLVDEYGYCCAIGAVCKARGIDTAKVDYSDAEAVGDAIGISRCMAAEIAYENDECGPWRVAEAPQARWARMRNWVSVNSINPA